MKTIQVQLCRLHQLGLKMGQKLGLYLASSKALKCSVRRSIQGVTRTHSQVQTAQRNGINSAVLPPKKCKNPFPAD